MKYQIDQSGKIEQTSKDTVLACCNGNSMTIMLRAREKAVLIYQLIKTIGLKSSTFIIDTEYPGRTKVIEDIICRLSSKDLNLRWSLVGKNSAAHDLGYKAFKKKICVDKQFTAKEAWKLAVKGSNFLSKLKAGGRLNTGLSPTNRRSAPADKSMLSRKREKVK